MKFELEKVFDLPDDMKIEERFKLFNQYGTPANAVPTSLNGNTLRWRVLYKTDRHNNHPDGNR